VITFWVNRDGSFGLANYLANRGRALAGRFRMRLYEDFEPRVRLSPETQIFSALDQLTGDQRQVVADVWDAHLRAAPDSSRLNDPRRALGRFELLTRLQQEGINAFRVFRATDVARVDRFPVFVRHERDHDGALTGLLQSRWAVVQALCALRTRGHRLRDLLLVELCDTSAADGTFRKYAAFKVGDAILACHLMVSREWCVKSESIDVEPAHIEEGRRYVAENPHREWLRRVFAIAGIDFGRVDYGVLDGVPQVWEINLNPTIGGRPGGNPRYRSLSPDLRQIREESRREFHRRLQAAFVALDREPQDREIVVPVGPARLARIRADEAERRRRERLLDRIRRLYLRLRPGPSDAVRWRLR